MAEPTVRGLASAPPQRSAKVAKPARFKAAARRRQLLEVASGLVAEAGLPALTMERVAARADVSKPVLYSHFANRAELLVALLEQYWANLDQSVAERLHEVHDFDGQLEAIVRGYFDAIEKGGLTLHLLLGAEAGAPIVEQARSRRYEDAERHWSAIYEQKLGLPSGVAQAAAALLRSGVEGVARYWLRTPGADREACLNTCIAVARGGLHALAEPERDSGASRASRRKKR